MKNKQRPKQVIENVKPYLLDQVLTLLAKLDKAFNKTERSYQLKNKLRHPNDRNPLN